MEAASSNEAAAADDGVSLYLEQLGLPVLGGIDIMPKRGQAPASDGSSLADESTPRVRLPAGAFAHSPPFLLALEQAIWSELVMCMHLTQRLAPDTTTRDGSGEGEGEGEGVGVSLPEQLLALLPPPPKQGWPSCMPDTPDSAEWLRRWGYPPVRRAQRLSFLLAAGLPSLLGASASPFDGADPNAAGRPADAPTPAASSSSVRLPAPPSSLDRQALLQKTSVRERLQTAVIYLGHRRQKLAALTSLAELHA